jgi:hypothetical protein
MCDRDSKREADRERRARIKAGTWDFPNGGAAEFAKAGAAIHTSSKRLGYSSQSPDRSAKPEVFTSAPAPAPRPAASAPRVTAPTFAALSRQRRFPPLRPARRHRRQWSRLMECPVVALFPRLRLSRAARHRRCLVVHEMARED